ncbi:hypothetical protein VTN00DRAFT_6897 [Thermoascus crustaceus]|uniref:uncharacterized protein n=1 Tax=Thermoascus crustaceus TaxID=5088 RepID=UPI003742A5CE
MLLPSSSSAHMALFMSLRSKSNHGEIDIVYPRKPYTDEITTRRNKKKKNKKTGTQSAPEYVWDNESKGVVVAAVGMELVHVDLCNRQIRITPRGFFDLRARVGSPRAPTLSFRLLRCWQRRLKFCSLKKAVHRDWDVHRIHVRTIDAYQGGQRPVSIPDLTFTDRLGFMKEPQRLTVGLSRGQYAQYIVGNINAMEDIRGFKKHKQHFPLRSEVDPAWYPAENFKGSPHRLRSFHERYPNSPGSRSPRPYHLPRVT